MVVKAISLKYHLSGEVEELLQFESMSCPHTKEGVFELINQLSTYKEEGKPLFPEVYITDDLQFIQQPLINCEFIVIGKGQKSSQLILKALKKCAPLALGGWAIYIYRNDDHFEYGLFRSGSSIISIPASSALITDGNKASSLILIRQVAEKIVEVSGTKGHTLVINFGIKSTSKLSPLEEQEKIISKILEKVDDKVKDQCRTFLDRVFLHVMQNGHGSLCLVLDKDCKYPDFLNDGIVLGEPISFANKISEHVKASEQKGIDLLQANSALNGAFNLISGMMMSDGITIFKNDGTVCAFNIFIKHPPDGELVEIEGGARSRTFQVMCKNLSQDIRAAYIQSQDGKTQTKFV